MKICLLKNSKGELLDISFVDDNHKFGKDKYGNYHIDGSETDKKESRETKRKKGGNDETA